MNNRRNFLKAFGIGAITVPLIGGNPDFENTARIVEPPKVELVENKILPFGEGSSFSERDYKITVVAQSRNGGGSLVFDANQVHIDARFDTSHFASDIAGPQRVKLYISGECLADASGQIFSFYNATDGRMARSRWG